MTPKRDLSGKYLHAHSEGGFPLDFHRIESPSAHTGYAPWWLFKTPYVVFALQT